MIERELDGFVVVGRFDRVVAAEDLLGLAIRSVGGARFAVTAERITRPTSSANRLLSTVNGFFVQAMYFSTAFCISSGLMFLSRCTAAECHKAIT